MAAETAEVGRRDADDAVWTARDGCGVADDVRAAVEVTLPQPVGEHGRGLRAARVFVGPEGTACDWRDTEDVEVRGGYAFGPDRSSRLVVSERERVARHGRDVKRPASARNLLVEDVVPRAIDPDEPVGIDDMRGRTHEQRVVQADERRCRAGAERENRDDDAAERPIPDDSAPGFGNRVCQDVRHREPPLLDACRVAPRAGGSFSGAVAGAHETTPPRRLRRDDEHPIVGVVRDLAWIDTAEALTRTIVVTGAVCATGAAPESTASIGTARARPLPSRGRCSRRTSASARRPYRGRRLRQATDFLAAPHTRAHVVTTVRAR